MDRVLSRALVGWMAGVRRHAGRVLVATGVVTALALVYAILHLGVNTRHTALLSEDLPFWKYYTEFAEVFPILDEALLVVIDAETPGAAREAAVRLAERLAREPDRFRDIYVPGGDPFFERNALLYFSVEELQDLTDQLASVQPLMAELVEDRSLANLSTILQDGIEHARVDPSAPLELELAFDSLTRAVTAVLEGRPQPISWIELLLERKVPGESSRRLIVLNPVWDFDHLLPGKRAIDGVRAAAVEMGLTPEHGVTVRVTGNVALNTEEMVTVAWGALSAVVSSVVLVSLILFVAMRTVHKVAAVLATLLVGLVWTAAIAAAAVGHINVVSIAFAVLFIGLGVDFGIHFGMRYAELRRAGEDNEAALEDAAQSVGGSLVLCAFTTAIGFFVFIPTDFRAVAELGLISGIGMLVSLFCSLTLLPAFLTLWRDRAPGSAWAGSEWFEKVLITASAHHPRAVRWCAAGLALASLVIVVPSPLDVPRVYFDHNVASMRDPSTESARTFEELLAESDTSPWTADIMAPSLDAAVATAERLRQLDVVERAVTLRDYVPDQQEEKLAILAELGYFVPEPPAEERALDRPPVSEQIASLRGLLASVEAPWLREGDPARAASAEDAARSLERFLRRLEAIEEKEEQRRELADFERVLTGALPDQMARLWRATDPESVTLESLPYSLAHRMLADDGRARIEVLPAEDLNDNAAHERFVDTLLAQEPGTTGSAVTVLEWARAVVRTFRQALASAIVAVAFLLWLLWRRLGDMALVLAPLGLAMLLTAATAALVGIPFNFANVIVLPLLLGIGVDSGIHLVHRHRVALETTGPLPPERELLETSTAQAVFFSALTTMTSFGTFALSSHVGFQTLGQLLLIGITYTLLANLVVLPALLARQVASATSRPDVQGESGA